MWLTTLLGAAEAFLRWRAEESRLRCLTVLWDRQDKLERDFEEIIQRADSLRLADRHHDADELLDNYRRRASFLSTLSTGLHNLPTEGTGSDSAGGLHDPAAGNLGGPMEVSQAGEGGLGVGVQDQAHGGEGGFGKMKSVVLVVGHEPSRPGALAADDTTTEFVWNSELVGFVADKLEELGVDYHQVHRASKPGESYQNLPNRINQLKGIGLAVELHFNAYNGVATGTETLFWDVSTLGRRYAQVFQNAMVACLALPDRGIKPIDPAGRGAYFLGRTACPALILEPFFGDNERDYNAANSKKKELGEAIAGAIHACLSKP